MVFLVCCAIVGRTQAVRPGSKRAHDGQSVREQADAARDANQLDQAQSLYRQALVDRPTWAEGWWSLGTILYDKDQFAPAARAFTKLLALDPKNGTAHLMLGLCRYQLGSYAASWRNIHAAEDLGIRKDDSLLHVLEYHKAMLLLRQRKFEDAVEPLKQLVESGVRSDDLDLALGMSALLMQPQALNAVPADKKKVIAGVGKAEELSISKKSEDAQSSYEDLGKRFPDYPSLHYAFGRFLLSRDEPDQAVKEFEQEIRNDPRHIRARMQIAAARYRNDSAAGIPFARQVVELQPKYPFAHYLLGLLYLDTNDVTKALPELETAARMVPAEAQFQFALGNAYAKAGRKEDAARARAVFARLSHKNAVAEGTRSEADGKPELKLDTVTPAPPDGEKQGP